MADQPLLLFVFTYSFLFVVRLFISSIQTIFASFFISQPDICNTLLWSFWANDFLGQGVENRIFDDDLTQIRQGAQEFEFARIRFDYVLQINKSPTKFPKSNTENSFNKLQEFPACWISPTA